MFVHLDDPRVSVSATGSGAKNRSSKKAWCCVIIPLYSIYFSFYCCCCYFSGSVICYVAIRLTHSEIMRTSRDQPIKSLDSIHVWICMRRCSTIDPPTGALSRCTADTQNQIIVSYGDMSWNVGFELPLAIEALLHCLNYEDTDPVLIIQNVPLVWRVFITMSS